MANRQNLQIIKNKGSIKLFKQIFNLYGLGERKKSDKGGHLSQKNTKNLDLEKHRNWIQHTENAYRYGSSRTRNTNIEEPNYCGLGRQHMFNRMRK